MSERLQLEAAGDSDAACPDCGGTIRTAWGFAHQDGATLAAYFVTWANNEHEAYFDVVFGRWGEGSRPGERAAIALVRGARQREWALLDASERPVAQNTELAGHALRPDQVRDRPLEHVARSLLEAVLQQDPRVAEVTGMTHE